MLGVKAKSKSCEAMKGLIKEGGEAMKMDLPDPLRDSAIICAAQKVEHYEMAGYGTLRAWANALGLDEVAGLLDETLGEEEAADQKLTDIAGGIISEAASLEADGTARTPAAARWLARKNQPGAPDPRAKPGAKLVETPKSVFAHLWQNLPGSTLEYPVNLKYHHFCRFGT